VVLRWFLPNAEIDILLEDWVAPLLEGTDVADNVIPVGKGTAERAKTALALRRKKYDVAFNLHGGTTGTFFTYASGARHRVGFSEYQYSFLYNHLLSSSVDFWKREPLHSAEQQLALLGFVGVPVDSRPKSRLPITTEASNKVNARLSAIGLSDKPFALIHPAAAFDTKQWPTENFARIAEYLSLNGTEVVAVAAPNEAGVLEKLAAASKTQVHTFSDLSLPEITAMAEKARIFVGNDSGIAHIAAAVATPSVVIFGSSNRDHWRPWMYAPNEVVYEEFACQPCAGYECKEYGEPRCILSVRPEKVIAAIDRLLKV
jgi:lipopolysaccharide heptosyltransferase II